MSKVPRRRAILLAALALFAVVLGLRLTSKAPSDGVTFLFVIPVILVAAEFGARAGVAAGVAGLGLFTFWVFVDAPELNSIAFLSRGVAFPVVGALVGRMAERLRAAAEATAAGARFFELSSDLLTTANRDGYLLELNGAWEATLGWSAEELTARPLIEFVHPDDREQTEREVARLGRNGVAAVSFANRYRTKDGGWRWLEWSANLDAEHGLIYAAARDVSDRRAAENGQRDAEERFRRSFEDSGIGKALIGARPGDADQLIEANEALARLCGCSREQLVGVRTLSEFVHPDDRPSVEAGLRQHTNGEVDVYRCEFRLLAADGRETWVELTTSLITDAAGAPAYRISQLQDIDARKRGDERLRHLADHDPLSGVYNRRRFRREVERELGLCARQSCRAAVLMLDLDHFKSVNDRLGHAAGDEVIARLGRALLERLRSGDVAARLGGDEFAVLLRRVTGEQATTVANGFVETIKAALAGTRGGAGGALTVSVGVAPFDDRVHRSYDDVVNAADAAMYDAKANGGDAAALATIAHLRPTAE